MRIFVNLVVIGLVKMCFFMKARDRYNINNQIFYKEVMANVKMQKGGTIEQLYGEGDFIDAKDNQGDWRVGFIIAKFQHSKTYKVRFDGWSSKYDEVYKFNSLKLRPFRSFVVGYTGQRQNPGLREGWKFSLTDHQQKQNRFKNAISTMGTLSVHSFNQLFRGWNYMYTDFLMTCKFNTVQEYTAVFGFFRHNIEFLCNYLRHLDKNFDQFIRIIENQQQMANWLIQQAFFKSYYEIFDTAFTISGNYARLQGFYKDNGDFIKEMFANHPAKEPKSIYQTEIIREFLLFKGMQAIDSIIEKILSTDELVSFVFLFSLTNLIYGITCILQLAKKTSIVEKLIKISESNLSKLKDAHFKEFHKHFVSNFLESVCNLAKDTKFEPTINDWSIGLQLELSLKMIKCPYFEKKLKGINHIIQVCEKSESILKNGLLTKWIEKVKLFEILFVNNDNHQFIKKSCELVKFLNCKQNVREKDIKVLWKSRIGKHETILKEIYNLLSEFPLYEHDIKQNLKLFLMVSDVPEEQWDEDYIHMIRQFSENSYGDQIKERLTETFGYEIIYSYVLKTGSDFAINELVRLLHRFEKSKIYNRFQEECFKNIEKGLKEWTHIKILLLLCQERIESFDKLEINVIKILIKYLIENASNENTKQINESFELLSESIKYIKKEIETQELLSLWKSYSHSINRESFLKWMYKKKDNGRIFINVSVNENHRKHLFNSLWTTAEQIKQMDKHETILFIELFKCVNIYNQKMKRLNVVIKPLSLELDGYEKLWSMLKWTENDNIENLICDFLAEIHTCYQEDLLDISIENLVQNIVSCINLSIKNKEIRYLTNLLSLSKKVIERDQEIIPFQHTPRLNYVREYTVLHKERGEEKLIRFNCMSTFYEFKKLISEKFNIPMQNLIVNNSKQEPIKLDHYFKTLNQNPSLSFKFEIEEDYHKNEDIKTCFNKKLDLFFELLDDARIEKLVWSIVEKLPISDDLKFKIIDTEDVLSELEHVGFYKQLYMLKVMVEMEDKWWDKFTSQDNIRRLVANFKKIQFKSHIELEYLSTLTNIIAKMLVVGYSFEQFTFPKDLFKDCLGLLRRLFLSIQKEGSKSLDLQVKIIKNIFTIGQNISNSQILVEILLSSDSVQELFVLGLISIPNQQIRKCFCDQLKLLFKDMKQQHQSQLLQLTLINLLTLAISMDSRDNLKEYFNLASIILGRISISVIEEFIETTGKGLPTKLFNLIQNQTPEFSSQSPNISLIGYLSLLKNLVVYETSEFQFELYPFILRECLFTDDISLCKSKQSRMEALNLLKGFMNNEKVFSSIISYLINLHRVGEWRTRRLDDWTITLQDKMKSTTGYVGIKNLGCICYMNSFMQQLFMIPQFRTAITSADDPTFDPKDTEQNLLYQIQKMFLNLENSDKKFYIPKDFCNAFKDYDGNPTNVSEQMDIDQFSNILFDKIETQTRNTNRSTLIKDMFGGVFSNEIVCKGCPHYSQTEENFLSISLTVKNKKNIYQSFDTMIKGDTLDGDNAYFCERCNKKVSAVKRVSLKQLPNYLIVTLKRFEFDYEKMMKLKVNDYCEFPANLNLRQYSRQYLRRQENSKVDEEQDQSNEYFNYVLKGVVVHLGYADSGHYYSFIQDRNSSKWFQFNDTIVRGFNFDDLAQEAFGGQTTGYDIKEKIKNAYMLIYEREKKIPVGNEPIISREEILSKPTNGFILSQIKRQNKYQKVQTILFSSQYNKFISNLIDSYSECSEDLRKNILKYIITVYLTVNLRQKSDGTMIHNLLKRINNAVEDHPDIQEWVVGIFSERKVLIQFFKNNLSREVKRTLAYWLVHLYSFCCADTQRGFCNLLLNELVGDNENSLEYCLILYQISLKSRQTLEYLIKNHIFGRYIENICRREPRMFTEKLQVLSSQEISEIGNEILIKHTQHELMMKKIKLDNENGYIWALINLILRRPIPIQQEDESYTKLTQLQMTYIFMNETKNYKILEQIKNKFQLQEFTTLLSFLTIENKTFLLTVIQHIYSGLKDFQSKRYRQFFLLFEKIIRIEDKHKELRLQAFKKIVEALAHNEQYSLDSNIIQQWIIILLRRNQALKKYLLKEKQTINYLYKLTTKKTPSEDVARKNSTYGEFMINKLHGVKFPKTKKGYTKLSEDMADFYEQIMEERYIETNSWPDMETKSIKDLAVGDQVAYFDSKEKIGYQQAKIESHFLGRVELSFKKNRAMHIWKDDEKLMLDLKCIGEEGNDDLNSSRTMEMDIDEDEDVFEDI